MTKIRIESDGTAAGTRVYELDGEGNTKRISRLAAVSFTVDFVGDECNYSYDFDLGPAEQPEAEPNAPTDETDDK